MKVSPTLPQANTVANEHGIKKVFTQKLTDDQVKELRAEVQRSTNAYTFKENAVQHIVFGVQGDSTKEYEEFTAFLKDIGFEGKKLSEISQSEAAELVSEDGIFGIKQTSERIANFVINGSGGDEDRMRAGREGMIQGFKDAEALWGGELPEISQQTMQKSIEMVDKAMYDLGYSILNSEA